MTYPQRLRIINIVTQMEGGGAQHAAITLARAFRSRNVHAETWFLYRKRSTYDSEPGVRVLMSRRPRTPIDYASIFLKLIGALRRVHPHAVITHTHYSNIMGSVAAVAAGVRRRIATHHSPADAQPMVAQLLNCLLGMAGVYSSNIAVSDTVWDSFSAYPKRFRDRLIIVRNGIEVSRSTMSREESRARFGLPSGVPLIGSLGRLAAVKNHSVMVRALGHLPSCHWAVAGDGELRAALNDLACEVGVQQRTHFLGEVPADEVPNFLQALDAFVFPSISEAFGFAVVEAAGAGIPIICSNIPATRSLFASNDALPDVLFFDALDEKELADKVQMIINDSRLRARLIQRSLKCAERFSFSDMVDGYLNAACR